MDPLSDVLSLLKPQSQLYAGFDVAGEWSFAFPAHDGIKFAAALRGSCWGRVAGQDAPIRFDEGDCFLVNRGCRFVMASDLALAPDDPSHLLEAVVRDGIAVHNGGGEQFLVSGKVNFDSHHAALLFDALPPLIKVPGASPQAAVLRWALEQLASELRSPGPGGALVSTHLVHLMLVQILRIHLGALSCGAPAGWLSALADPRIGAALGAIHAEPGRGWTLEALARVAGVSRTVFAQRFKALAGTTVMNYLTRWRMHTAAERLRSGDESISAIAFSLGYESESAFSTAFKRAMQCAPSQYRRRGGALPLTV